MDSKLRFVIVCAVVIVLALAVFFLTGLVYVKKGEVVYLSRHGLYKKKLASGWHYVWPFSYRVSSGYGSGSYLFSLRLEKGRKLTFTAKIVDSAAFEFACPNWKILAKAAYLDPRYPEDPLKEIVHLLSQKGLAVETIEIR
jgi:hypothetical protein